MSYHRPERCKYPTITLRGDAQNIVHLESVLPEVIAMGIEAVQEFQQGKFPLGGPHAEFKTATAFKVARIHIVTPEAEFTYEFLDRRNDAAGAYYLLKRTYVSSGYAAWVSTR